MIKNKLKAIISALVAIYAIIWLGINYYFIPRIVLPKAKDYLAEISKGPLKFYLNSIRFDPFRGFLIDKITIKNNVQGKESELLSVGSVDIDLAFFPLLWKRIEVRHFKMYDVRANIYRSEFGEWNCAFLWGSSPAPAKNNPGGFSFGIDEFRITNGRLDYADNYKSDNSIRRQIRSIGGEVKRSGRLAYTVNLSAGKNNIDNEAIILRAVYDLPLSRLRGDIQAYTNRLDEYWDYYLDDILRPWRIHARGLRMSGEFSYELGRLNINSRYWLSGGYLGYGDLTITGRALITQKSVFDSGGFSLKGTQLRVLFEQGGCHTGKYCFAEDLSADVLIDNQGVRINDLTGTTYGLPFRLRGAYRSNQPRELSLAGMVSGLDTDLSMKFIGDQKASLDYQSKTADSYFKLRADIEDVKDHKMTLSADSDMNLDYLKTLPFVQGLRAKGRLALSGNIGLEADKPQTWQGLMSFWARDISLFDLTPVNFSTDVTIKNGEFSGDIPELPVFGGSIRGKMRTNTVKWGTELEADKLNLEAMLSHLQGFKGVKGLVSGNIALVGRWKDIQDLSGGGFFQFKDSDFREMPLFNQTQKSLQTILKNFFMPVFTGIELSCKFKDKGVNIDALCSAPTLTLGLSGSYSWSGKVDFTIGAKIIGKNIFKLARQIFLPYTLGFDIITQAPQIRITGTASEIKTRTTIRSMAWVDELLGLKNKILPYRYSLNELW